MQTLRANLADTLADLATRAPDDAFRTTQQLARLVHLRGMCADEPDVEDVHRALVSMYPDTVTFEVQGWRWGGCCEQTEMDGV